MHPQMVIRAVSPHRDAAESATHQPHSLRKPRTEPGEPKVAATATLTTAAAAVSPPTTTGTGAPDYRPLVVVLSVIGILALLTVAIMIWMVVNRRRQRQRQLDADYRLVVKLEPALSLEEFERNRKLGLSTVMLEQERQREAIIRKSLRNRPSVDVYANSHRNISFTTTTIITAPSTSAAPTTPTTPSSDGSSGSNDRNNSPQLSQAPPPPSPPTQKRTRREWRPAGRGRDDAEDKEMLLGSPSPPDSPRSSRGEADGSQQAQGPEQHQHHHKRQNQHSCSLIWERPNGNKCPPAWGNFPWNGNAKDAPPAVPPPSMKAKIPPIWSHPAFRAAMLGGIGTGVEMSGVSKSFTNDVGLLPSELGKVKPASIC